MPLLDKRDKEHTVAQPGFNRWLVPPAALAIHGRLLTAWAAAGVVGTSLINYIREYQIAHGVPKAQAYDTVMYVLAGLLVLGFLCNLMVGPVAARYFMSAPASAPGVAGIAGGAAVAVPVASVNPLVAALAWAVVGVPLLIGVWITLQKAIVLFK